MGGIEMAAHGEWPLIKAGRNNRCDCIVFYVKINK